MMGNQIMYLSLTVQVGDESESKQIPIRPDAAVEDVHAAFQRAHDWLDQQKQRRG